MPVPRTPRTHTNQSTRNTLNSLDQMPALISLDARSFLKTSMAASLNHEKINKKVSPPRENKKIFDVIIIDSS
jgi:hypothetical protein